MTAITADRRDGITAGLALLPVAMRAIRGRLLDVAEGLGSGQWAGPSRCSAWTAHQVVRHVRDGCRIHVGALGRTPFWLFDKPFDNRVTPDEWLTPSDGESPAETVDALRRFSAEEAAALDARVATPENEIVGGPYGPVPWTILSTHVFWDAWLHERDLTQVTGGGGPSTPAEEALAATYSLFICSMAAILMGLEPYERTIGLVGQDGAYVATVRPGHVELRAARTVDGTDLRGALAEIVDSLAGRGPVPTDVLHGDPALVAPLAHIRDRLLPRPG